MQPYAAFWGAHSMTGKNQAMFDRAIQRIPWATQTNAKRLRPEWDGMPAFIRKARGCRMWDVDGREFIDYRCALGPIILGYAHPAVDAAVRAQLGNGVLFSMASPLELEAAEAIIENTPWLEQLHFMKTGGDACSACLRLARAFTGRSHFLTCGYHGYHDWFTTSWPHAGIPMVLRDYVHEIAYNDIDAAEAVFNAYGPQLAAAIVEPYDWGPAPGPAFLQYLRRRCDETGALLIFDEVLTGFRLARGGAQEYFGVTPDLAAFAKALANGYPLSAFAGKRRYMQQLDKTVITTTYAGETLSLAACIATMAVLRDEPVHEHIFRIGTLLRQGLDTILQETGIPARTAGLPPALVLLFETESNEAGRDLQNRLFSSLFAHGIFANDRWFISYAHQESDIEQTLARFRQACLKLK